MKNQHDAATSTIVGPGVHFSFRQEGSIPSGSGVFSICFTSLHDAVENEVKLVIVKS